jgi:putative DNA primase/helicase
MVESSLHAVPAKMRAERRWVLHRDKVPYRVGQPHLAASVTDPSTWGTFDAALADYAAARCDGIGFVLGDGWVGVDLDKCRDPQSGDIAPKALAVVRGLNSYTEVSPSGTGLHIICRGTLPPGGRRNGGIELYDRDRYFTVTGHHV